MKIAVLLAGQLRNWDLISKIFKLYNKINPNIQYDFFLSTWDDSYNGKKSIESDFSFVNAHEIISTSVLNTNQGNYKGEDNSKEYKVYPYLFKRVNQLKNDYQNEYGITYDCVMSTRPDIYLNLEMLKEGYNIIKNTLYIPLGIRKNISSITNKEIIKMDDLVLIGDDSVINIHANLYDDMHVKRIQPNLGSHLTNANHVVNNDISYRKTQEQAFAIPVRDNMVNYLENLYKSENLKELYNPFSIINNSKDVEDMLSKLFKEHPKNKKKKK